MSEVNVISISGGKDSTALSLLSIDRDVPNRIYVFADTGNEHSITYEYLDYLEETLGIEIIRVKADFTKQILRKRNTVKTKWRKEGISLRVIARVLTLLKPTGNPFLDLCIWKGRFPSMKARFCTEFLKEKVIEEQVIEPLIGKYSTIISWQGQRADESASRAKLPEMSAVFGDMETMKGIFNYRPILKWTAEEVFAFHKKHGIRWNPLYEKGMSRVGCMPCVNGNKGELKKIAEQFPEVVERIRQWEEIVSQTSKRESATFFPAVNDPTVKTDDKIFFRTHGINRMIDWAKTSRGGRQHDFLNQEPTDAQVCQSVYAICE
ncbi:phosphoadenosine phosphosulfate reductase [Marinomonas piezotolerans]|uniref:Phosphoadenosine phosphosulfate reductase n=1 Tax=Marinomonas piezotolerans TaxID=2213058 RepID=A0A370UA75_9GAMM|nr:phosphoadenosine phosphosulfate reductase family protein [Marinomonas piezotolerans]RDL44663.1 phosphoadenosine phosphosulfate reductase [Marinomonas piezotolerans]